MLARLSNPLFAVALAALAASGCGYALQNSKGNSLEEYGVHSVYVAPVENQSYKPGVENVVFNELRQQISLGRRVKVATSPDHADAVLEGRVTSATYAATAATSADSIYPTNLQTIQIPVATEYQASISCEFRLRRTGAQTKGPAELWRQVFSQTKRFPGNNQKASFGTTSPLINESEFDRALREMAQSMMHDVHESMLVRF